MAKARQTKEWDRAAEIQATLANCHRDAAKRPEPYRAEDFHPFRRPKAAEPQKPKLVLTAVHLRKAMLGR